MPVYNTTGNVNMGYVTSFISGTGLTGTYGISKSYEFEQTNTVAGYNWPANEILSNLMLRTLAARVCTNCDDGLMLDPTANDFQWIATACMITPGNNGFQLTWYFQFTGTLTEWNALKDNQCFQICIYGVGLLQTYPEYANINPNLGGIYPYNTIAAIAEPQIACSYTQFSKITDECDAYPTAVLQYANVSDAFGFFYDGLGQLTPPGINYLESIRLPLYLHSPEYAEEQMSYQRSDGSTLKLVHRIWTDYKFKADYLDAATLNALVVATAHDFVFITSHYQGIDPWSGGAYQTGDVTQFVRNEKIEIEWQQETIPRFKLGQAKGTIRLAEPASNVNSNCV
jgi:hypothetical protein